MSKKKTRQTPPRKPTEFRTTPFKTLKGVVIATEPQRPAEPPHPAHPPKKLAENEAELFFDAMSDVKRLDDAFSTSRNRATHPGAAAAHTVKESARNPEKERLDSDVFSKAISQLKLDVTFQDHAPEDDELKPLGTNRLRQLKRGIVSVDRQLDLHGLSREEALDALPRFLESASRHGEKAVLVITGKGNNSPGEPVLQQAVLGWLRDSGRRLVVEFAPAPREMGGSGAFVVFLRM